MTAGATAKTGRKPRTTSRQGALWSLTLSGCRIVVDVLMRRRGQTSRPRSVRLSNACLKGPGVAHFVNRDMTQRLVAPPLDFGGTPSMCVVVSIGETDGHHCFKLHGAQQRQARR